MLDPQGEKKYFKQSTIEEKIDLTVISITHDLEEALLADRVLFMNEERNMQKGTPHEIFERG